MMVDIVLIVLIFSLIAIVTYAIYIYDRESFSCISNPIIYIEELKNISCSCTERNVYEFKPANLKNISLNSYYIK